VSSDGSCSLGVVSAEPSNLRPAPLPIDERERPISLRFLGVFEADMYSIWLFSDSLLSDLLEFGMDNLFSDVREAR
jgi:hypothetical protein